MTPYIKELFAQPLIAAAAYFLGALALGYLLKRLLNSFVRRLIAKTESDFDNIVLEIFVDRITWVATVAGAYLASDELTRATSSADILARQWLNYAQGVIFVSFVIVIAALTIRMVDASVKYLMERHARRTSSRFNEAIFPLLNRVIGVLIALIGLIVILHHFGQDVSSLVVSLGVGSLAIALAAQETLANMIGGFVIMTDRPFRVGDRIQLPSGEVGDVQEIGIRSTKILDFDNNLIVSPNADLIKGKIVNYSYPSDEIRILIEVNLAFGTDLDRAKLIMLDAAAQHPDVLRSPEPAVFLTGFGEAALKLLLVGRTNDYRKKFLTETAIRDSIYRKFVAEQISLSVPVRHVQLSGSMHVPHQNA
jgi:MscS family membrane protein